MTIRTRSLSRYMTMATFALLTFAGGGVVEWSQWLALAGFVVACLLFAVHATRAHRRVPLSALAWLGVGILGLTVLQALPLPFGLVRALSPAAGQIQLDLAARTGVLPGFVPLSLQSAAGASAARHVVLLTLAFALGYALSARPDARQRLLAPIAWIGVAFVLVAVAHALSADGLYLLTIETRYPLYPGASTFVNANHAIGLLVLTLPSTAQLAAAPGPIRPRVLYGAAALGQAALLVLTPSGSGVVALPVFVLLVAALRGPAPSGEAAARGRRARGALGAISLALLSVLVASEALPALLSRWESNLASSKHVLYRTCLELMAQVPWTGVGAGAFERAFESFGPRVPFVYTSPESLLLGAPTAFGLIAGPIVVGTAGWFAIRALARARRDRTTLGIAVAVAAFLVHDLVDFAIELPATGALFALLAGVLLRATTERTAAKARSVSPLAFAAAALILASVPVAWTMVSEAPRGQAQARSERGLRDGTVALANVVAQGRAYPLDGVLWAQVGRERVLVDETEGVGWLEYAATVSPNNRSILMALTALQRTRDPGRYAALVRELVDRFWTLHSGDRRSPSIQEWLSRAIVNAEDLRDSPRAILGDDPERASVYARVAVHTRLSSRRPAFAALVRDYADDLDVLIALEQPLAQKDLAPILTDWKIVLLTKHDGDPRTWQVFARAALRAGNDREGAVRRLLHGRRLGGPYAHAEDRLLVELLSSLGRIAEASEVLAELEATGRLTRLERLLSRAEVARADGRLETALQLTRTARIDDHGHIGALRLEGTLLYEMGRKTEAAERWLDIYRRTGVEFYLRQAEQVKEAIQRDTDAAIITPR